GQMLLCVRLVAGAAIQLAETEMAVGDEGTHPELESESDGGVIVRLGRCDVGVVMMRGDLAQETKAPRLGAPLFTVASELKRLPGAPCRVIETLGQEIAFAEPAGPDNADAADVDAFNTPLEQRKRLSETSGQGIRIP